MHTAQLMEEIKKGWYGNRENAIALFRQWYSCLLDFAM
jgi:hypothetical protein